MNEETRAVYRCAMLLLEKHGPTGPLQALDEAFSLEARGDEEGAAMWLRIAKAANQLVRQLGPGSMIH
jgi:hypothetical protein